MALDSAGDLYIADEGNKRIREVLVVGGQTAAAPLAITTGFLPPGTEGMAYDTTLAASGGTAPYTWQAAGLPDGLGIDPGPGEISGTPQASGDFSVTATVYDSSATQQSSSAVFDLAIGQPLFAINATSLPSGTVGTAYTTSSTTLVASGGTPPYAWSAIGLPGGLRSIRLAGHQRHPECQRRLQRRCQRLRQQQPAADLQRRPGPGHQPCHSSRRCSRRRPPSIPERHL